MIPAAFAQSTPPPAHAPGNAGAVFIWALVLIAVVMVGGLFVMWLRRRLLAADSGSGATEGLMESLRRMRDKGQMSQEEYDAARKAMASRFASKTTTQPVGRQGSADSQSR